MNKDELIKFRNNLKELKQQTQYYLIECYDKTDNNLIINYHKDQNLNIELAKYCSGKNELETLNYLEKRFENTITNVFMNENNLYSVSSIITVYFIASSMLINELEYNSESQYSLSRTGIDKDKLLKPYVVILFSNYYFLNQDSKQRLYDKKEKTNRFFLVNYNNFSELVKKEGFEINIDNYDDLIENHVNQIVPEIKLNFKEEKIKKI